MMSGCSIRALWILNSQDCVIFSKVFPVVEKRWRLACEKEINDGVIDVKPLLPTDAEISSLLAEKKRREGSACGFGVRVSQSVPGSDSWVDDPITRHLMKLVINREEGEEFSLWPIALHIKGGFSVLVLPLVEPRHYESYERICRRSNCGNSFSKEDNISSLIVNLPCITGAFMVAHIVGDIVTGDSVDPEVVTSSSPSVGGLLDSITGSIGITGISSRAKPLAAPVASSAMSNASTTGSTTSDTPKSMDMLRSFISSSMPFGTPLDLNVTNISAIRTTGFSTSDLPPTDLKQPAWKPYLYKGKQRIIFTIHETISAAMYDRDDIPDAISVSGQINCRAELEGLPDVSFPLTGLKTANAKVSSFHHCAQVSEQGVDKHAMMFSPPLGNFTLMRYQASCNLNPPVKGFYQLSMVSEDEGAFLFKLKLMEGYKSPLSLDFCSVTMPFPRRRVASFDGTPTVGTVSMSDHFIEWKIIISGRGVTGKSIEASFSGNIRFLPRISQKVYAPSWSTGIVVDEDSDVEEDGSVINTNVEELMDKMNKDLQPVELEEPLCWQAYNYAKVSFKITGGTVSGISIDRKSVSIYPAVKAPVEDSMQASSGDYILWNTLGKCPSASHPDV